MSAINGLWSSWKPVNEANNHGLDMVDVSLKKNYTISMLCFTTLVSFLASTFFKTR